MSKELLAKLNDDLKLAGYKKRSCQSYIRAVRQLYNFWSRPLEELEKQHVLPTGFMKIRHSGFLSPNFKVPIQKIRELISVLYEVLRKCPVKERPPSKPKPLKCAHCQSNHFVVIIWHPASILKRSRLLRHH